MSDREIVIDARITRYEGDKKEELYDLICEERRIDILLNGEKIVSLLCLPEKLRELAAGFLHSEGLLTDIGLLRQLEEDLEEGKVLISYPVAEGALERFGKPKTLLTGCGKGVTGMDLDKPSDCRKIGTTLTVEGREILALMKELQERASLFRKTGCCHSSALADGERILLFAEDVGRHNAVDKIIGGALLEGIPLNDKILLTSGRITSEIAAKAVRQKIPVVVSRAAPSAMALRIAEEFFLTLAGFVRGRRMNIYTYPSRIKLDGP